VANEVQTQSGQCPTHGTVEATRDMPRSGFPWIYNSVRRKMAGRKPFVCPECGADVESS
jgi:hypothetical protein